MPYLKKVNNARTTVNQAGGIDSVDTEVIVTDASDFPNSGDFLSTIWDNITYPDPSDDPNQEIVKVTNVSGNIFTIERAIDNTTAHSHGNNSALQMLITALHFEELEDAIDTLTFSDQVFNDVLTDQVDGIETEFTTSFDYESGTLIVYLNGIRQIPGISKDYVETGDNTFEFNDAPPESGWKITTDYVKKGSASNKVFNEELTSQVDGIETEFTTAFDYVSGELQVYLNGFRQIEGIGKDFVETGSNTFEFNVAPSSTSKVVVDYTKD